MTITRTPVETIVREVKLNLELQFQCENDNGEFTYSVKSVTSALVGSGSTIDFAITDLSKKLMDKLNGFAQK